MSFFNFFKNSEDKEESGDEEKEGGVLLPSIQKDIDEDYEVGKTIAEEVIPYSLEYYMGINPEGEDYEDLDDDEDDDDEDDEDGDDDDDDKKKKSVLLLSNIRRIERRAVTARNLIRIRRERPKSLNANNNDCVCVCTKSNNLLCKFKGHSTDWTFNWCSLTMCSRPAFCIMTKSE